MKYFILFCKNPSLDVPKLSFKACFATYLFYQILIVPVSYSVSLFIHNYFGLTMPSLSHEHKEKFYLNFSVYNMLLMTLIGPIVEEVGFRLSLELSKKYIGLSLGCILFILLRRANREDFIILDHHFQILISVLTTLVVSYSMTKANVGDIVIKKLSQYFGLYVYFMAIIFAIPHIFILNYNELNIFSIFFALFPFFLYGMLMSFFRLSYGFGMCLFIHIFHNSFNYTLKLLVSHLNSIQDL